MTKYRDELISLACHMALGLGIVGLLVVVRVVLWVHQGYTVTW